MQCIDETNLTNYLINKQSIIAVFVLDSNKQYYHKSKRLTQIKGISLMVALEGKSGDPQSSVVEVFQFGPKWWSDRP